MRAILLILSILFSCNKNEDIYKNTFNVQSLLERTLVTFYENNNPVKPDSISNPENNSFDGRGGVFASTPKYNIKIYVRFNIYGHIELTQIDSCYNKYVIKPLKKDKVIPIPKKIIIMKHIEIMNIYKAFFVIMAGISPDEKAFLISELALTTPGILTGLIKELFIKNLSSFLPKKINKKEDPSI
jgi:hypothetical protein